MTAWVVVTCLLARLASVEARCTGDVWTDPATGKEVCFPNICAPSSKITQSYTRIPPNAEENDWPYQAYSYQSGWCSANDIGDIYNITGVPASETATISGGESSCGDGEDPTTDMQLLVIWAIVVVYMFYGLAHVCEDFLVPSLDILCERNGIPEDVAGATLLAAGCNAPELFASVIGVFLQHSTVGVGTVIGSAPFNIMCITAGAAFAVGGYLVLKPWFMAREIFSISVTLGLFIWALDDQIIQWYEALVFTLVYVLYVFLVVYTNQILSFFFSLTRKAKIDVKDDEALRLELMQSNGNKATPSSDEEKKEGGARGSFSGSIRDSFDGLKRDVSVSLGKAVLEAQSLSVKVPSIVDTELEVIQSNGLANQDGARVDDNRTRATSNQSDVTLNFPPEAMSAWSNIVADCRRRVDVNRANRRQAESAGGADGAKAGLSGTLLKKSRFYSRVRMGRRVWQRRHFILDDHESEPFRYQRTGPAEQPVTSKRVVINLFKVDHIELVSSEEVHLSMGRRVHKLRCEPGAPAGTIQQWFDELVVKLEEIRTMAPPSRSSLADLEEEDHEAWWQIPESLSDKLMFWTVIPLKAMIHLTIPDVHNPKMLKYYGLTLALATAWLAALAFVMTLMLNKIGCALNVSELVMGLTAGAVGTSFPNLYASILTAKAGQGDQSICQAFGSNTFNILIALGLVWLLETAVGTCEYGIYTDELVKGDQEWCAGCYKPLGVGASCPYLVSDGPPKLPNSLIGTTLLVYFTVFCVAVALILGRGVIMKPAAYSFFVIYLGYLVYEVLTAYEVMEPVCLTGSLCL